MRKEHGLLNRNLLILFFCLFLVMVGYGLALSVLPFYVERLALRGRSATDAVALHVGLLTALYAAAQFVCGPLWGRWSDRHGRKPVVLASLAGYAISMAIFGLGTTLPVLYSARLLGGVFAAGMLPAVAAYVSDVLPEGERSRGMAWMNAAAAMGVVAGPAVSGLLARKDWHLRFGFGHWILDSFSVPFLAVAAVAALSVPVVVRWLREPKAAVRRDETESAGSSERRGGINGSSRLVGLLALVVASQFGMALFMTTFALYGAKVLQFGPRQIGYAFAMCGLLTAAVQVGVIGWLSRRVGESRQVTIGFATMGGGLLLVMMAQSVASVLAAVGVLVFGAALIAPNLLALISRRSGRRAGQALGFQGAATSLGQTAGPLLGSVLFAWRAQLPFQVGGGLLLAIAAGLYLTFASSRSRGAEETTTKPPGRKP